jgi:PAS domain S-box-containing protein
MIIKRFNRKFELLSGYDSAEVIGKKIDFLFPKEKIAATLELLKNHLDDEQEVAEIDILTKDNKSKQFCGIHRVFLMRKEKILLQPFHRI